MTWIIPFALSRPMTSSRRARSALPRGTVTFMFTDIEGSTRLWETQRASMQKALARHDALLRNSIERHHGHIIKTTGDGACAAFDSATDALEASVAAQQDLGTEPWPDPIRIRVRMALHTGPAEFRDGDYYGPTVNRVARLLALGHGGQTLVSEVTHDLCRDYLPVDVALASLGEHTLKDIDRPESVFEVRHAALSRTFPPLRELPAPALEHVPSIAVLPFVNMSREQENEYFADGLAEELLNVLAKIHGLRVAARTSSFHFKGKDATIAEVGRALNVATALEGSVRNSGNRMRITVQLIKVADG
jgi:class 3 adenylate cyclase